MSSSHTTEHDSSGKRNEVRVLQNGSTLKRKERRQTQKGSSTEDSIFTNHPTQIKAYGLGPEAGQGEQGKGEKEMANGYRVPSREMEWDRRATFTVL